MQLTQSVAKRVTQNPARVLALSFLLAIFIGTILLCTPLSWADSETPLSWLDALFTATSAVCVTGLVVVDTATFFSPFGKGVILALIQVGALGIMSISTAIALILRQGMSMSQRAFMFDVYEQRYAEEFHDLMRTIFKGTFLLEGIGALILAWSWHPTLGDWKTSLAYGLFHSVSAFCNAGFSLFTTSLEGFADNGLITMTIALLVILGGLGFTVLGPLLAFRKPSGIHSFLALVMTGILLVGGTMIIFYLEFSEAFLQMPLLEKLHHAFFQVAMSRTAGFNTVNLAEWGNASLLIICFLMFVGASPGSTGGGIKTTTLGVLIFSVRALLMGREDVDIHARRLDQETVLRAITMVLIAVFLLGFFAVVLLLTETQASLRDVIFEVFSAFGTVGLTLGLTPHLTGWGKFSITCLMFLGRIGPVTLAYLIGGRRRSAPYRYPIGRVMVG